MGGLSREKQRPEKWTKAQGLVGTEHCVLQTDKVQGRSTHGWVNSPSGCDVNGRTFVQQPEGTWGAQEVVGP